MSTVADDNKETLLRLDCIDRVHKLFKSWGATDEQAEVAAASQAKRFKFDGVQLTWAATGTSAIDDPSVKAFYADAGFKFLLPPPKVEDKDNTPQVDPILVEQMRQGNKTAEAKLFRQLGGDRDEAGALAQLKLLKVGNDQMNGDHSKNPFVGLRDKNGKIVEEQMRKVESLLKAVGTKRCAAIAASAGYRLDGTRLGGDFAPSLGFRLDGSKIEE